jgi:diguanylate cyclase (GGDEF)-like protein/PAS domain S-box-containing protein
LANVLIGSRQIAASACQVLESQLANPTPRALPTNAALFLSLYIVSLVGLVSGLILLTIQEKLPLSSKWDLGRSVRRTARSVDSQTHVGENGRDNHAPLPHPTNTVTELPEKTSEQSPEESPDAASGAGRDEENEHAGWFQMLVEQSPDGIYVITDRQFVYTNAVAAQMFGYTTGSKSSAVDPLAVVHPNDRSAVERQSIAFNNASEQAAHYEMRGVCRDGRIIDCAVSERRVMWNGQPSTLGIVTDITAQKAMHDSLVNREQLSEAVNVAANLFLKARVWEEDVPQMLALFGSAIDTSSVSIYSNHTLSDGTLTASRRYHWASPELDAVTGQAGLSEIRLHDAEYADWAEPLSRGELVQRYPADFPPEQRVYLEGASIRALLAVPIFVGRVWWGFLALANRIGALEWSVAEENTLKLFASLFGAAMERQRHEDQVKRLYESERQRRRLAETLYETGTALNATLDFNGILDTLLGQVQRIVPYDLGLIMLLRDGRATVERVHSHSLMDGQQRTEIERLTLDVSQTANLRWMAQRGQPVVIPDTAYYPEQMAACLHHIGSWMQAPLMAGNVAIGFLLLGSLQANTYNADTATYVAPFASQVAFALQNARLYADAEKSLARERLYNEIVRAISSSLDLPDILRNIAYMATGLVKADAAAICLADGDGRVTLTTYANKTLVSMPDLVLTGDAGVAWQVMRDGQSLLVPDYAAHPRALADLAAQGVHGMIVVPITAGESSLGVMEVFSLSAERQFGEKDVSIVETVGKQTGIAIQKALLLEAAHKRAEEAETLRQAGAAVTSTLQLQETFERILEQLERVVPFDTASVQLLHSNYLEIVGGRGWPDPRAVVGLRVDYPGDNPNTPVIRDRQPLLLTWADMQDATSGKLIQSWLGIPLIIRDQVIGMLSLDCFEPGRFRADHIHLVSAFADHVSVAIENARLFERVQQLAITDDLTGLFNRRRFFELAEQALARPIHEGGGLSVLMIDLDLFKQVNDTYGHLAGDQVLREVAQRCRSALRADDILARYGGEEFVALLRGVNPSEVQYIAERLRAAVCQEPVYYGGQPIRVAVSVGVSSTDPTISQLETLLIQADEAQYMAKSTGGNRSVTWNKDTRGR